MANCCDFVLKAKGFRNSEDVNAFIDVFKNNFEATPDGCDDSKPYMAIYGGSEAIESNGIVTAVGMCKWSVCSSMTAEKFQYYDDAKRENKNSNYTCLEDLSKKYGLIIEVYSREGGMGFEEHYAFDNGRVVISKTTECSAYYIADSYEEFLDECDSDAEELIQSEEDWNRAYEESGCYCMIYKGGFDSWNFCMIDNSVESKIF